MDQSSFAAPHGFSQRITSFIACACQGIHQMPLRHLIVLIANAHHLATVPKGNGNRPGYLLQPSQSNNAIDVFDRSALLELRRAAHLQPVLRPASRDMIRYRAVRQRQSSRPSDASSLEIKQTTTTQSDKLPTYLQSLHHIRPARPSIGSAELGSDAMGQNPQHLEASRSIFSSQCMQNRHQALADANFYFLQRISLSLDTKRIGGAERDRTADPLLAKQVLSQLSYSPNHRNT
jgi:hypothetical protein